MTGTNVRSTARWWVVPVVAVLFAALGCSAEETASSPSSSAAAASVETAWVEIGSELFELELALDPQTRFRGLGGRRFISPTGGMLFINEVAKVSAMVMRDCPIAIDVAFLDSEGRVVAMHAMPPEPARRSDESDGDYERRLPIYSSVRAARFSVETAGGRLAELGVEVGDPFVFDTRGVIARAIAAGQR